MRLLIGIRFNGFDYSFPLQPDTGIPKSNIFGIAWEPEFLFFETSQLLML